MIVLPAHSAHQNVLVRESARVATVAHLLDCDQSTVRRMVASGSFETHQVGKRGIRIFLDSVAEYQAAKSKLATPRMDNPQVRARAPRAAHATALAALRESGILP
jgi:excisionase family DNA binding protein